DESQFEPPGTNPFVMAAHDPFSTFGADVDTASYEIFRRYVGDLGVLPPPASVRLEELVNYFDYGDAPPTAEDEHPFSIAVEAAPSPFTPTTLLRIGITGEVLDQATRAPANLVFLVDVSGSMSSDDKLPYVKTLLRETLDVLRPTDTVAIVTYASAERVALPATPVSEKAAIRQVIDGLAAGGSTAGQRGLAMAYDVVRGSYVAGGFNHVILCTDGDFNVGIVGTDAIVSYIEGERATGVTLTVVGFGTGNLNDAMMEAVSNAGDGVYAYIGDADSAVAYAHDRMLGSIFFIAKDLKIQLAFNPARVHAYRLLGYENNAIADEDFVDDTVDAGEIGSGLAVTALYELVLGDDAVPAGEGAPEPEDGAAYAGGDLPEFGADDLAELRIRYKHPGAETNDPAIALDRRVSAADVDATFEDAGDALRFAGAVAAFAEILKHSPYGSLANLDVIGAVFAEQAEVDPERAELAVLFAKARALLGE
ncbi:MAG: von Willebrand factor type A domain-containing protein, partial [Myxococcales bacterium]|nr:von Willebrand factor type A domain-containing protein [Myxococcales bacterium]